MAGEASFAKSNSRARSSLVLVQYAESVGLAADVALAGAGLTVATLNRPDAVATRADELQVITNIVSAGAPTRGGLDAGARYHLTTFGIWGFALISSPTVAAAAEVGMRFVDLISDLTAPVYEFEGSNLAIVFQDPPGRPDVARFVVQRDLTFAQAMLRDLVGPDAAYSEVTFTHQPEPGDLAAYEATFHRTPVFGAARNALVLDAALLDAELPQADPLTLALSMQQCNQMLDELHARAGMAGQVRDIIVSSLRQPPTVVEVADLLHMSERTLRRRLTEEGTSLRALVEEVRSAFAAEFLRSGSLTVAEISDRLGYVEPSSFSQAFRRWHGVSPRAFAAANS